MTGRPANRNRTGVARIVVAAAMICAPFGLSVLPASALSEIKREEPTTPAAPAPQDQFPGTAVPLPDPIQLPRTEEDPADVEETDPAPEDGSEDGGPQHDAALPEIIYDLSRLPEPTRRMHALIVEACRSGDIERLRPLIGPGESATQLSFGGPPEDPIAFLKELSGDPQGHEILAILLEVLNAGFVHLDAGTESELYVWPYFFAVPLERLSPPQRVELFKIVTAGDYADMKSFGAYIFYRAGITPDGHWAFFVAGD